MSVALLLVGCAAPPMPTSTPSTAAAVPPATTPVPTVTPVPPTATFTPTPTAANSLSCSLKPGAGGGWSPGSSWEFTIQGESGAREIKDKGKSGSAEGNITGIFALNAQGGIITLFKFTVFYKDSGNTYTVVAEQGTEAGGRLYVIFNVSGGIFGDTTQQCKAYQ